MENGTEPNATQIICPVCEHQHEEDGTCTSCNCEVEQQMDQFCWSCGHATHIERPCKCGCDG